MKKVFYAVCFVFLICTNAYSQDGANVGDQAPPLSVDEWLKGTLSEFKSGTVYLVEFWGTWCSPCIKNIPHLTELQKKYSSDGFVVIGVATHETAGKTKLMDFMKERGDDMEYMIAYDSDLSMERDWDTGSGSDDFRLPVCFLIDRNGKIVFEGHPENKELEELIKKTLEER